MDSTAITSWVRDEATLSLYSSDYTSAKILQMCNQTMSDVLEPLIAGARSGYWCHTFTRTLGINNDVVRLPPRSCPAIEQVDISWDGGRCWEPLSEALEAEAQDWMNDYGRQNRPFAYVVRSSYLKLLPAAAAEGIQLRIKILVRPSVLVEPQSTGLVVDYDADTRIVEVINLPVSKPSGTAMSGTQVVDIIEPRANFELALCDAIATVIDPTHVEIAEGYGLARIEPGDYMRFANQSEWPQLPESFHKVIGSITAIPICRQRDMHQRAEALSSTSGNTLSRLSDHIKPRVRVQQHRPSQHDWR